MSRRGLALLVVVGVLGVLAVLATAFVTMARLERRASQQRVYAAKALLLARSGLEDALARLALGQDPELGTNRYGGEDWQLDGDQGPASFDRQQEAYHLGVLDTEACPLRQALRPSFFARDGFWPPRPALAAVEGRQRGYSGRLAGDLLADGNHYALRVTGEDGFDVNGGDPSALPSTGHNAVLRRMLGTLAEALDREDGSDDGLPVDQADGERLIDARPQAGWRSFGEIRDVALGGSASRLGALRGSLSLSPWVDRKVIDPTAQAGMIGQPYRSWWAIKLAHSPVQPDFARTGSLAGRAPVGLGWARARRPALIALLAGLKGVYLDETVSTGRSTQAAVPDVNLGQDLVGRIRAAEIALDWTQASDDCRRIADAILAHGGPLDTWERFDTFCDGLGDAVIGDDNDWGAGTTGDAQMDEGQIRDLRQAKRDLIKANFNPNSVLNKFGPNRSTRRLLDKTDLLVGSTEFSLFPAGGRQLGALGRVRDRAGRLLASREVAASCAGPMVVRITTQREFVAGDLGDLEVAGDERNTSLRLPGHRAAGESEFITPSWGDARTWGHRLDVSGLYPGTWMDGNPAARGVSLQSYPEPCFRDVRGGGALSMAPADYDGSLQLATVETPSDALYGVDLQPSPPAVRDMKLLARFDDHVDLDLADSPIAGNDQMAGSDQMDYMHLLNPSWTSTLPPALYPDGVYSEADRIPSYFTRGNLHPTHGLMSFWVKHNWVRDRARGALNGLGARRGSQYVDLCNYRTISDHGSGAPTQFFVLGYFHRRPESVHPNTIQGVASFLEINHDLDDMKREHKFKTAQDWWMTPFRWHLMTFFWDLAAPQNAPERVGHLVVDGGALPSQQGFPNLYATSTENTPTAATDLTQDDGPGLLPLWKHRLRLGFLRAIGYNNLPNFCGEGPDVTFDEFAAWDFDQEETAAETLASGRYREGRYGRGWRRFHPWEDSADWTAQGLSDVSPTWFSAPIALPAGTKVRRVSWSWRRPVELPDDYAEIECVVPDASSYLWSEAESRSTGGAAGWPADRQDWTVGLAVPGPFRLRVVFRRNAAVPLNTPILDSPVLDDITLLADPAGGVRMTVWREDVS